MTTENNELVCLTIFDDDTDRPLVRAMVEREVFAGYHKARNHDRYLAKKARARECSYDAKESQGISGAAYLDHLTAQVSAQAQPVESSGVSALDLAELAELERIAPGYAKEWLSVELARDRQRRLFRLLGLGVTMVLAVFAIGFGQWALVNGATSEALFLSGTGLVGLVGAFLSKN